MLSYSISINLTVVSYTKEAHIIKNGIKINSIVKNNNILKICLVLLLLELSLLIDFKNTFIKEK
jgi:hypothetical protein